jgi:plasmid segregation protein ParM
MTKLIGLDVGYGFIKATDGETGYSYPSVVGEGHTKPTFSTRYKHLSVIDNLKIGIGSKLYFVGKSAIRHSKFVYRDLSYTRNVGDDFEVLFFSALSLFCNNRTNEFKVVTGLPLERMHMAKSLEDRVRGEKELKIYRGKEIHDSRVYVSEVEIVPQPLGTYWSHFVDSDGDGNSPSYEGLTGVIDIGFRTTDLATIEEGEYIPEKSKSLSIGLATAYNDIGSNLATEYGLEKESYALDGAVIKRQINFLGKTLDISEIVENAFEKLAINVLVEINSLWRISDFDNLILTGGGGQAISSSLLPKLPHAKVAADPITANCRGFLTWGKNIWQSVLAEETDQYFEQELQGDV